MVQCTRHGRLHTNGTDTSIKGGRGSPPDDQSTVAAPKPTHLLATAEAEHQVEGGLLLDVVVGEGAAILQLLASKDEALLVRGDPLLVLDLGLDIVDGIRALNLQSDGLPGQGLDEDLHTTTETEDQVEGGLLLDIVVGQSAAIFELFACEDKTLLIRRNAFLILNLRFDVIYRIGRFDLESNGLASQGLDKDLHTATKTEDEMESRLLLDIVIRESATILKLLSSKDQALLVRGNALLVLDLGLDVVYRITGLYFESNSLPGQGLDEDLHDCGISDRL